MYSLNWLVLAAWGVAGSWGATRRHGDPGGPSSRRPSAEFSPPWSPRRVRRCHTMPSESPHRVSGLPGREKAVSWNLAGAALDINSFTPVRMLADCVGTIEVLQYQRSIPHVYSVCFASTPHTYWLNCDSSDTVGLTPQICKGNHDEPCAGGHLPPVPGQSDPYPHADVSGRCCWEAFEQKSVRTSGVLTHGLTLGLRHLPDIHTR